ncbi:DUF2201 family putative metallopeptidase [uncultured Limosilactobacillus sp.]|uniref:vWA domain-containing protein n=1 Tax=uncultured Limosilactobacillus sp. TaxID=2837629 RepID=UPI0025DC7FE9|nr:VWA-like domain-containing protein [uncultured Limosilactobacillus sp.]
MRELNAQQRISQAITEILQQDPLMGEILVNISRETNDQENEPISLVWHQDEMILQSVSNKVISLRMDELVQLLKHQALHIVWQHPVRYANCSDQELVGLACDIAVNQYLTKAPVGTMTLEVMSQILHQRLTPRQDSGYYLKILRHLPIAQQKKLQGELRRRHFKDPQKNHGGWFVAGNQLIREGRLRRLLQQSRNHLTAHQRGLIPQAMNVNLNEHANQYQLPFCQAFWQLVRQVPRGQQSTRARFNRRQPQRLELMGTIIRYVTKLTVFIDQSGSMRDETISQIITTLNAMAIKNNLELLVGDFDAKVQSQPRLVKPGCWLPMKRHGGGGTRYQAVFDYLEKQRVNRQNPVIIVTDGWGETVIKNYGYQNVLWLLTSDSPLSVTNVPTMVSYLKEK